MVMSAAGPSRRYRRRTSGHQRPWSR